MKHNTQTNKRFFRVGAACEYLDLGRTKLHDLSENDPSFPRKIRISARCVGWTKEQLDTWLNLKTKEATQ